MSPSRSDRGRAVVDDPAVARRVEHCMGTVFSIDVRDAVDGRALDEVIGWLHWVDDTFSTYQPGSAVSRLGSGRLRLADCPPEVAEVLDLCAWAQRESGGYFTAVPGGRLDPSGLVKGWAVERASAMLRAAGAANHSVNGGGDVRLAGEPSPGRPWRIGVAHPLHPGELATVVTGRDLAVATSGTAERGRHVIDPFTGRPAEALASVTVVGPDLTTADAFATAAVAMGAAAHDWLETRDGFAGFAVTVTGELWWTSRFEAVGIVP